MLLHCVPKTATYIFALFLWCSVWWAWCSWPLLTIFTTAIRKEWFLRVSWVKSTNHLTACILLPIRSVQKSWSCISNSQPMWAAEASDSLPRLSVVCQSNCLWEWAPTPLHNVIWPPPWWSSTWPVAVHHTEWASQSCWVFCHPFYRCRREKFKFPVLFQVHYRPLSFLSFHGWFYCWLCLPADLQYSSVALVSKARPFLASAGFITGRMPWSGKLSVLNLPTGQKSVSSPCRGDSLHRFTSNLAWPRGCLATRNFMPIGARGWERGPQK